MPTSKIDELVSQAIAPGSVVPDGSHYTKPRTWGVYEVTKRRRYRFGNHPVRQQELERELGSARLHSLFTERSLAEALARELNA